MRNKKKSDFYIEIVLRPQTLRFEAKTYTIFLLFIV